MKTRAAFVLVVASMLCNGAWAGPSKPLDPRDGTVLSGDNAKAMLHQCSRGAPEHADGLWQPNAAQIHDLEVRLPKALADATGKNPNNPSSPGYGRQYAGLIVAGHKIIYVNAFPRGMNEAFDTPQEKNDWHTQPVVVCDGGPSFFGAEYDPATKTFANFAFNGFP